MPLILDASVTVAWAFSQELFQLAQPALVQVQKEHAVTPALWQFEVASAMRKTIEDGRLSPSQASSFLADLGTLDIRLSPILPDISRLMELAEQFNISTYDAAYLELALQLNLPLATLDTEMAVAARKAGIVCFL
jgi:predicted nucleic acid-binding protein